MAPLPIALQIIGSLLFCLLGALQFLPSVRRAHPRVHRHAGRLVVAAGGASALSGLWMTVAFDFPPALQGPALYWGRIVLSLSMVGLIAWAVAAIRHGKVAAHRAAMLRAHPSQIRDGNQSRDGSASTGTVCSQLA